MTIQQAVKKLMKSNRILVNRKDDKYIICNNYFVFAVSEPFYKADFVTTSGLFKEIDKGGFWIEGNETRPSDSNLSRLLESKDHTKPLKKSPFLTDWNSKDLIRVYITEDNIPVYVNDSYIEILETLFGDDLNFKTIERKEKISMLFDEERQIAICPIRNNCPYKVSFEWLNK